jgi:hypothetical protein
MIPLKNKPNVIAPNINFSYGSIKDDTGPGTNDGTPVNTEVYSDMHMFFESLMAAAGITPNNTSENDVNGYQLIDALTTLIGSSINAPWRAIGSAGQPAFTNSWANVSGGVYTPARIRKESGGTILRITGSITGGNNTAAFTLTGSDIPAYSCYRPITQGVVAVGIMYVQGAGDSNPGRVTIYANGTSSVAVDIDTTIVLD